MTRIAILGASHDELTFLKHHLRGHTIAFHEAADMAAVSPATEVLSVFVDTTVTAEAIARLPELRLIACRSTGTNNVDMAAAKARGITVANVPTYGGVTVAEYTFTLLLMLSRRMVEVLSVSGASAPDRLRQRGTDLAGKTIGIVGTGSIGMGVARIAKGFGMEVLGYDLYPRPEEAKTIGFTYCDDVAELMQKSHVVTLHVPYTPENHHLLRKEHIHKLRHGAIVINTARGELIDTPALVDALRHGHVAGAALDVLEDEYLMDPDKLIDLATHDDAAKQTLRHGIALGALQHMPNVILTDHNAYNTTEAVERINRTSAENIVNFLNGQEVHAV